jgi:hypothetical protein
MSKLDALRKEMKALKSKMRKEGEVAMKEAFKELFDSHPVLDAVGWTQYTPYFNDGDTCTFSVNDMFPVFVKTKEKVVLAEEQDEDEDCGSSEEEEWYDYEYGSKKMNKEQKAANKALTSLVEELGDMDEIFYDIFGDHVRVRASRAGFKVTEYEHE